MKKASTKLVVRSETLRVIASIELTHAVGGDPRETGAVCTAPAVVDSGTQQCPGPAVVAVTSVCG
jgi:hypothetical protein